MKGDRCERKIMNNGSNEEFEIPGYKITEKLYESRSTLVYRGTRLTNGNRLSLKS